MHSSQIGSRRTKNGTRKKFDDNIFVAVKNAANGHIKNLAERWVSKSRVSGDNLIALNPTRADRNLGSFAINTKTGAWADSQQTTWGGISFHSMRTFTGCRKLMRPALSRICWVLTHEPNVKNN